MSKSKSFGPGRKTLSKGTTTHCHGVVGEAELAGDCIRDRRLVAHLRGLGRRIPRCALRVLEPGRERGVVGADGERPVGDEVELVRRARVGLLGGSGVGRLRGRSGLRLALIVVGSARGEHAQQADEEQKCECFAHPSGDADITTRTQSRDEPGLTRLPQRFSMASWTCGDGGGAARAPGRAERSHGLLDPSFSDTSPLHEKATTSFFRFYEEVLYLPGRLRRLVLLALAALTVSLGLVGNASAQLTPPWCGTPVPDAAENLPDGTDPTDPVGSFPHIPYYAIGCTLDGIEASQLGDRMTVEQIGVSALGRPLYGVVFNAMETPQQIQDYNRWVKYRGIAARGSRARAGAPGGVGRRRQGPVFVQGAIHGNEYEGVESNMQLIKELATTPYGANPKFDDILNHVILVFNVIQNPDGRVAGTTGERQRLRPEPRLPDAVAVRDAGVGRADAEVAAGRGARPARLRHPDADRGDDEAAQPEHRVRPLAQVEPGPHRLQRRRRCASVGLERHAARSTTGARTAAIPPSRDGGVCPDGSLPGPAVAESWDDWGPFYTPMYAQHVGLDGSTVEMCNSTGTRLRPARLDARTPAAAWAPTRPSTSSRRRRSSTCRRTGTRCSTTRRSVYRRGVEGEPASPAVPLRSTWTTTG